MREKLYTQADLDFLIKNEVIEVLNFASETGEEGNIGDIWWNNRMSSEDLYEEYMKYLENQK